LDQIKIPVFAFNARDDWVCNQQFLPFEEATKRGSNVILALTEKGSHCCHIDGFFKPKQFYPLPIMRFLEHMESTKKQKTS
jgi:predicted alpha/beta-fold hydrolase